MWQLSQLHHAAVYFTLCGVELTSNSLLCAPASLVMVGCWPVLSTAVACGMHTFLVGFPGSVPVEIGWGQVIEGGRMSENNENHLIWVSMYLVLNVLIGDYIRIVIWKCWFWGEGKIGVPGEKPLGVRTRASNKLNPHMRTVPGIEPSHSVGRRVLSPLRYLCSLFPEDYLQFIGDRKEEDMTELKQHLTVRLEHDSLYQEKVLYTQ